VLAGSPAAYWRLGEASGTEAADTSGNGRHAGYRNGVTLNQAGAISDGNAAVSLDGVNDHVAAPNLSVTGPFTLELWANPRGRGSTGATAYGTLLGYGSRNRLLWNTSDGRLLMQFDGNFFSTASVPTNAWSHIVYSFDGSTERFFINGAAAGSHATTLPSWNAAFRIGDYAGSDYLFNGRIDDVAVYRRALSASEVDDHFKRGTGARAGSVWDGRGIFTWDLTNPLVSDSTAFADRLKRNGFSWVAVWGHDATIKRNENYFRAGWLDAFRAAGLKVCAWGGLSTEPEAEAAVAMEVVRDWRFDCYIANAEDAYKTDNSGPEAWERSDRFVASLSLSVPVALSTYGAAYPPWNLAAVINYTPWRNAGYHLLPQAYWNVCSCYEPLWVIQHSLEAGWPLHLVHPTAGIFSDFSTQWVRTGADYAPLFAQDRALGHSAYLAEGMTEADYTALGGVR
jgi:hypothetical protein